jgi:outer membrane protein assembly factor BamD (BamD/ComL family)
VRPSLALLHEAYTKLGMSENAKQIEQIIEFNKLAKFDESMLEDAN